MKNHKKVYLLLANNGFKDFQECVFEKEDDANNYATFLINSGLSKNTHVKPIEFWYE